MAAIEETCIPMDDSHTFSCKFYVDLFEMLSNKEIGCDFKIGVSTNGRPYPTWSAVMRTVMAQPTLLDTLICADASKHYMCSCDDSWTNEIICTNIGKLFTQLLYALPEISRPTRRTILVHNLEHLFMSYTGRNNELFLLDCINRIVLTKNERTALGKKALDKCSTHSGWFF